MLEVFYAAFYIGFDFVTSGEENSWEFLQYFII